MSDKALPDWVKVNERRFNVIKNENQQAKRNNLQTRPNRDSPIFFDELYKLVQDIDHSKITRKQALKIITNVRDNIKRLSDLNEFNPNQVNVINTLFMVDEIFNGEFKWYKLSDDEYILLRSKSYQKESIVKQKFDKQPDTTNISDLESKESDKQTDTTNMPELESEKSAAQRINKQGEGLKILTPNQMLRDYRLH